MAELPIHVPQEKTIFFNRSEHANPLKLRLIEGNLILQNVDAIVTAANPKLIGGGGVDFFVEQGAGPGLREECKTLHGCKTGGAKITAGYNLLAKHVIHAVGPIYPDKKKISNEVVYDEKCKKAAHKLAATYRSILRVAKKNGLKTIAIPAISTGIFGFPPREAAQIVHDTLYTYLREVGQGSLEEIRFILRSEDNYQIYDEIFLN